MQGFFRAYRAVRMTAPSCYFIESTAPNNVDDTDAVAPLPLEFQKELEIVDDPDEALQRIARALASAPNPNLVVMVHGFNNPQPAVLRTYADAAKAIVEDDDIRSRSGLVCVGYRWPSESMGMPWRATWAALPTLPTWVLYLGAAFAVVPFLLFYLAPEAHWPAEISRLFRHPRIVHVLTMGGLALVGLILMAALLRIIVYFRDNFRATNYGVPDLIQIIRAIDGAIVKLRRENNEVDRRDVELSFIGHSMGGFVVTNTIRALSDVFAVPVETLSAYGVNARPDTELDSPPLNEIGNVFKLMRFVLASPDIPAETLLSSRGNFLASTLSRFDEAYLFSNEGDEVLRQISTLANYFVFPTKSRNHGFRLGNVEILSRNFGLIDVKADDYLRVLRIGNMTLQALYDVLEDFKAQRNPEASAPVLSEARLPKVFTYFDCTDYVEPVEGRKKPLGMLTFAKCTKRYDPDARLRWYSHLHLLFAYVARHQKPNVHGGYFQGALSQALIYRLACLGYQDTIKAYHSEAKLSETCAEKQIRVLVSPRLRARRLRQVAPPPPSVAETTRPAPQSAPAAPPAAPAIGVVVPNLVGMPITEARAAVAAIRDIHVGPVALPVRGSEPQLLLLEITRAAPVARPGTVLDQTPAPGSRVEQRTSIEVGVAK
jgi:esterase/lipase superfamily enzyme